MKRFLEFPALALLAATLSVLPAGCGGDGDDGDDDVNVGDNDVNLVACVGDSITQGYNCIGDPYPTRLAAMSGKQVLNYGVGGSLTDYGASIIGSVLARKPGDVCLLYGSNDCIHRKSYAWSVENLRRVVRACKNNRTKVIIATVPPQTGSHLRFNIRCTTLSAAIRVLAEEEGVPCVDLNKAFGDGSKYLNPEDGLHLSNAGGDLVARKFNSKL